MTASTDGKWAPWLPLAATLAVACLPGLAAAQALDGEPSIAAAEAPTAASHCTVDISPESQLMITDLSVVNDPVRTRWTGKPRTVTLDADGVARANADGAWHFGQLMTTMAGTRNPSNFVRSWLEQWTEPRLVNGFTVPARTAMQQIIDSWPKTSTGALDLTQPPMRLLAIVNRFDLKSVNGLANAGEGRFVFGVLNPEGTSRQFTVILEYKMLAGGSAEKQRDWATAWGDLTKGGVEPFGDTYRARLQRLTDRFTLPTYENRQNGSAISQVRTNEISLAAPWELREFRLNDIGQLRMSTTARTPDNSFNGTSTLAQFLTDAVNSGQTLPLAIPDTLNGASFKGANTTNNIDAWFAPGFSNAEVRHSFSLNTCNGCHGRETNTSFLHVNPRSATTQAKLSGFLTGVTVKTPVSGELRTFNELESRRTILRNFLCGS